MAHKIFKAKSYPGIDNPLLWLRISTAAILFAKHGYEKLFTFDHMYSIFPDPIGIGKLPSLLFALLADGVCSILIALGLFTRIASLIIIINLAVAFFIVQKMPTNDHGEMIGLFFATHVFLLMTGPGKKSLDYRLF